MTMHQTSAAHEPRTAHRFGRSPPNGLALGSYNANTSNSANAASSSFSPLQSPPLSGATRQRIHAPTAYSDAYYSPPVAPVYRDTSSASYHTDRRSMADMSNGNTAFELEEPGGSGNWAVVAGKHLLRRLTRAAKTANWPMVIAFSSCVVVLLRALSGAGYVPPSSIPDPVSVQPESLLDRLGLPDSIPTKGWTHAWDVWRQVTEDLRNQIMQDREKWVGSVRPERERGRWGKGGPVSTFVDENGTDVGLEVPVEETLQEWREEQPEVDGVHSEGYTIHPDDLVSKTDRAERNEHQRIHDLDGETSAPLNDGEPAMVDHDEAHVPAGQGERSVDDLRH